ncbi:MAG TPA: hypothetical protein VF520_05700 [Thermoleophilaceae bacterium]
MRRLTALASACLALVMAAPAGAVVREIGRPEDAPFPLASCPENCQAVAQVTGYQVQIGAHKNPYLINRPGKIVAFTIRLGKPNPDQVTFFRNMFGGPSRARLSVLKPAKTKRRHRLLAQSDLVDLEPYFGSTPTFALDRAIRVEKGNVLALTTPTWTPSFAHGLASDNAWRSSHHADECTAQTPPPAAQMNVGSLRIYGCFYRTARLLYSASFVPDPKPTTPPAENSSRR